MENIISPFGPVCFGIQAEVEAEIGTPIGNHRWALKMRACDSEESGREGMAEIRRWVRSVHKSAQHSISSGWCWLVGSFLWISLVYFCLLRCFCCHDALIGLARPTCGARPGSCLTRPPGTVVQTFWWIRSPASPRGPWWPPSPKAEPRKSTASPRHGTARSP